MTINTTSLLTNSVRAQYLGKYLMGVQAMRVYDRFASAPVGMDMSQIMEGTSLIVPFLSSLPLGTSTLSQITDVAPVRFRDTTASITATSRGNAINDSELLFIQAYTNYNEKVGGKYQRIGENMIESVDLLAQAQALTGTNIHRAAARASLDAGTTGHRLSDALFAQAQARFANTKAPQFTDANGELVPGAPGYIALMPPEPFYDLRTSGLVDDVGMYQQSGIVLDFALGRLGPFQIAVTPWAKTFLGAGAANGSAIATTLNGAVNALATSIVVASATNIDVGDYIWIGTAETGDTHYPTNERVRVSSVVSTTIGVIGQADNGGLKWDHASGETVGNADPVYPIVFGGPASIAKLYSTVYLGENGQVESGTEFGALVMPHVQGNLHQWSVAGWKYYGGYGRWVESWLLRAEVSSSMDA